MEHNEKDLFELIKEQFGGAEVDIRMYSPLALAYIGDSVFDLLVRSIIVSKGNMAVQKYHKQASSIVNAHAQARMITALEPELTEEEHAVYKRGRNSKPATTAKNASVKEYKTATGLEALIGYLYLSNQHERLIDLVKKGLEILEENH